MTGVLASPAERLDVEVLARALSLVPDWRYPRPDERGATNVFAERIAAEYERLREGSW